MATLHLAGPLTPFLQDLGQFFMDSTAEFHKDEIGKLTADGMSEACAADVSYLRTRSRHTTELEARLIAEHKAGVKINICEWPYG